MTSRHLLFALAVGVGGCGSVAGDELYREYERRSLPDGEEEFLDAPAAPEPGGTEGGPQLSDEGDALPESPSGGDDEPDAEDPDDDPSSPPVIDTEPPTIAWTEPSDGARAVRSGAPIVIQFSEPMAREATEAALTSDLGDVMFLWSEGDTRLTLEPATPLEYAMGEEPLAARTYTIALEGASDLAGNTLTSAAFSFATLRRVTLELAPVRDRRLTGTVRADGLPPSSECATALCAGEESGLLDALETQHKAFVSFDLAALPADLLEIVDARLDVLADDTLGDPFAGLGELHVERSDFRRIGSSAFSADPDATLGVLASLEGVSSGDIRWVIQEDLAAGRYSQFRLCFPQVQDNDGSTDLVRFDPRAQRLSITYLVP